MKGKLKEVFFWVSRLVFPLRVRRALKRSWVELVRIRASRLHARQVKKWRSSLDKEVLNVVFEVYHIGMWKNDELLKRMMAHPRINPVVWIVPHYAEWDNEANMANARAHFEAMGATMAVYSDYPTMESLNERWPIDLLFLAEPYVFNFWDKHKRSILDVPFAFVSYCFRNSVLPVLYNQVLQNVALFNFCENEYVRQLASGIMDNRGVNMRAVGYPFGDCLLAAEKRSRSCARKCIVWAPHWTVVNTRQFVKNGTFLDTAEPMLALARKFEDEVDFVFKPHPSLHNMLAGVPEWGAVRADEYWQAWRELPNGRIEEGEYLELFRESDALIHDCGSFTFEYLYMDKPCMFLMVEEKYPAYNQMAEEALECYHQGRTREEIEAFIRTAVLGGQDTKAGVRREFREKYLLPPGGSAAENIIRVLLDYSR